MTGSKSFLSSSHFIYIFIPTISPWPQPQGDLENKRIFFYFNKNIKRLLKLKTVILIHSNILIFRILIFCLFAETENINHANLAHWLSKLASHPSYHILSYYWPGTDGPCQSVSVSVVPQYCKPTPGMLGSCCSNHCIDWQFVFWRESDMLVSVRCSSVSEWPDWSGQ